MERYDILKNMPLLNNCCEETLMILANDTYKRTFSKNDVVLAPDAAIHKIAIVANSGRMKIVASSKKTGEEYIAYILTFGDIFNVTTLFDGRKDALYAVAVDDLEILFCNIDIARGWINHREDLNKNLLRYLSKRLQTVQNYNLDRTFYSVEVRLAKLIFENIASNENHLNLINDLSHDEIAKILGTSRAVVNRNLQKLREEDLIEIKRKKILIEDYEKLKAYIEQQSFS